MLKQTCSSLKQHEHEGVYIFVDDSSNIIYYVGETRNLASRVYRTHCKGLIGSSEGVVRFLMYIFARLCKDERIIRAQSVAEREKNC